MSNYDNAVLGTENSNHPFNQREIEQQEELTKKDIFDTQNVPNEVLDYVHELEDALREIKAVCESTGENMYIINKINKILK